MSETTPTPPALRLPRAAFFIIGNEACERFSYYGMASILTLYMTKQLKMEEAHAKEVAHAAKMAVYLLPLLGAFLADLFLGRYWTIMSLSLFYCLGHGVLAVTEGSAWGLYTGLALIALGAGGIKPCVSAFMGDQFSEEQKPLLPRAFNLFYWAINFGSFFSFIVIPLVRDRHGYSWAFGIPGLLMLLAWIVFAAGSRTYRHVPPALRQAPRHEETTSKEDGKRMLCVLALFSVAPFFWALFDQTSTSWVVQGDKMAACAVAGFTVNAEMMQSLNPALVMLLIPLLTFLVFPALAKKGIIIAPLPRMVAGMALAASAFVASAVLQWQMDAGAHLSVLWQSIPYLLLTIGEILFSATGLEFAYTVAPKKLKSLVTSLWLLTVMAGNFLVVVITILNDKFVHAKGSTEFLFYAGLTAAVTVVFAVLAWAMAGVFAQKEAAKAA